MDKVLAIYKEGSDREKDLNSLLNRKEYNKLLVRDGCTVYSLQKPPIAVVRMKSRVKEKPKKWYHYLIPYSIPYIAYIAIGREKHVKNFENASGVNLRDDYCLKEYLEEILEKVDLNNPTLEARAEQLETRAEEIMDNVKRVMYPLSRWSDTDRKYYEPLVHKIESAYENKDFKEFRFQLYSLIGDIELK